MRRLPILLTVIALLASCAPADASPPPLSNDGRPARRAAADLPPLLLTDDAGQVLSIGTGSAATSIDALPAPTLVRSVTCERTKPQVNRPIGVTLPEGTAHSPAHSHFKSLFDRYAVAAPGPDC